MSDQIREGTAAGLVEFADYLIEKGYAPTAAGNNWKGATRNVFQAVDGEGWGSVDVKDIDLNTYLERFEIKARGDMKQESIVAYRKRVSKAVEAYRGFLTDPNWKPPTFKPVARRPKGQGQGATVAATAAAATASASAPAAHNRGPSLIDYPFPLRSGEMAHIRLPARMEKDDAERLGTFIRTLVFEPRRELPPGEQAA